MNAKTIIELRKIAKELDFVAGYLETKSFAWTKAIESKVALEMIVDENIHENERTIETKISDIENRLDELEDKLEELDNT